MVVLLVQQKVVFYFPYLNHLIIFELIFLFLFLKEYLGVHQILNKASSLLITLQLYFQNLALLDTKLFHPPIFLPNYKETNMDLIYVPVLLYKK